MLQDCLLLRLLPSGGFPWGRSLLSSGSQSVGDFAGERQLRPALKRRVWGWFRLTVGFDRERPGLIRGAAAGGFVAPQTTKHLVIAILTDQLVYPSATNEDVIPGVRGHSVTARQVIISVRSEEHTSDLPSLMPNT